MLPLSDPSDMRSSGRIAVLGGNEIYTGAPYFTGMAALHIGAEFVSIYTSKEAAVALKSYYSLDLTVESIYDEEKFLEYTSSGTTEDEEAELVDDMVHVVTINFEANSIHC
jgi:NAD(P)H-hydrate repair Nnr-like enzyme with NAD(P)H-hydrate dehydratase domain